jgi:hypothetical protein
VRTAAPFRALCGKNPSSITASCLDKNKNAAAQGAAPVAF